MVNVVDFGAVADDATDNREAFQSADRRARGIVGLLGGGALYVPPAHLSRCANLEPPGRGWYSTARQYHDLRCRHVFSHPAAPANRARA